MCEKIKHKYTTGIKSYESKQKNTYYKKVVDTQTTASEADDS